MTNVMHKLFSMCNLCITLVIYQESLNDARSTKCKIKTTKNFTFVISVFLLQENTPHSTSYSVNS